MRGLGTYLIRDANDSTSTTLYSSAAGTIGRINKLVSVKPIACCSYQPEVGDLVVARISAVENKRWRAHIQSNREAVLQLSSVSN